MRNISIICNDGEIMRKTAAMAVLSALAGLLGACGSPDYRYAHDSVEKVYFRVPYAWSIIDQTEEFFKDRPAGASNAKPVRVWTIDSHQPPDPKNVDNVDSDMPVGQAQLISVSQGLGEAVSVSSVRASGFKFDPVAPATGLEDTWEVITDQPMRTKGGISGSIAVFNYRENATDPWLTQAREVFVDAARKRVYILDVFCTAKCYQQYERDIFDILDSWRIDA